VESESRESGRTRCFVDKLFTKGAVRSPQRLRFHVSSFSMRYIPREHTLQLLARLVAPPAYFPPVEIPDHLRKPAKSMCKRGNLLVWWLTYRLPVERLLDASALAEAAKETRLSLEAIETIRTENPIHWERMLLKRQLRLDHFRKYQSVPDGVTPGWPLGRNADRVQVQLYRRKMHPANPRAGLKQLLPLIFAAHPAEAVST
jgi:hypothetical protein